MWTWSLKGSPLVFPVINIYAFSSVFKLLESKSASTNLRPLFSAGKQWIPSSGWVSYWPPSGAAQLSGYCSWAWDEQEDCCGEERAEPVSQPFDLPVDLCSYLHLWARSRGGDRTNEIADAGGDVTFLHRVAGLSLRDRRRSFATQREVEVELLQWKEPVVMVQASEQGATWEHHPRRLSQRVKLVED